MSRKRNPAVLTGALLTMVISFCVAPGVTSSAAATAGRQDTEWVKARTTVLGTVVSKQQDRIDELSSRASRQGSTSRLRSAVLKSHRSIVALNAAVVKVNGAVLSGDGESDDVVSRLLKLNAKVVGLDARAVRVARGLGVLGRARMSKRITTLARKIAAQSQQLKRRKPTKPAPVPTPAPTPTPTPTPLPPVPMPDPAPSPEVPARPAPVQTVSVRSYGARGDGVTDDYNAIQAAIDACGTDGGEVVFPAGVYYLGKASAGGLKLPAGNADWLVLSGDDATIKLSAGVPRFLDFKRTADHQTFARFWVEGFEIDANNVGGEDHVVGFSFVNGAPLTRINVDNVMVRDVHAYNVRTDTTYPDPSSCREGVYIATKQWAPGEPTINTIKNIYMENVKIDGGNVGFSVGGVAYGDGWPDGPNQTSIHIDNVQLRSCSWDSGKRSAAFWPANGMIMGWGASGGRLYVQGCDLRGSGDNNYEINGWTQAVLEECVSEDSLIGYFVQNCGWPLADVNTQQIVLRNCVHRNTAARGRVAGAGWVVGNENPLGSVTLDGCSMTSEVTSGEAQFLAMWDGPDYKIKALNLLDCTYQESGVVTDRETYPFKVFVRCDGSPSGEPTAVNVSGMRMYYRSTRVGTANYVVRLFEMGGSKLTWVVRDSQFDAGIQNGSAAALRGLCMGDAFTTKGSGVVDRCVFKMQGAEPWAVRVGDSDRLTIDGTVDVQNSDFSGIDTTGTPVYVSRDDANNAKVRLVNNVF